MILLYIHQLFHHNYFIHVTTDNTYGNAINYYQFVIKIIVNVVLKVVKISC